MHTYSVSEVNTFIKRILSAEDILYNLCIHGEVSNFKRHHSGHLYFQLKDASSMIKCIMFKNSAELLPFLPENGMEVIARGNIQAYERDGVYQLYCTQLHAVGIGDKTLALEQVKNKLLKEGLFDEDKKRALPWLPKTIGVITSRSGAALYDIIKILKDRNPMVHLKIFPALVQGEKAAFSICKAIDTAKKYYLDLLIIGRGGGSSENLEAFDNENVVRSVAEFPVPVISAVGHEVDVTLTDFAADKRAPTPSAAAEMAVPDITWLKKEVDNRQKILYNKITQVLSAERQRYLTFYEKLNFLSPITRLEEKMRQLHMYINRLHVLMQANYRNCVQQYEYGLTLLSSLGPMKVLVRGYAVCLHENQVLKSVKDIQKGEKVKIILSDGMLIGKVEEIKKKGKISNDG